MYQRQPHSTAEDGGWQCRADREAVGIAAAWEAKKEREEHTAVTVSHE